MFSSSDQIDCSINVDYIAVRATEDLCGDRLAITDVHDGPAGGCQIWGQLEYKSLLRRPKTSQIKQDITTCLDVCIPLSLICFGESVLAGAQKQTITPYM